MPVLVDGASSGSISSFIKPHTNDIVVDYVFGGTAAADVITYNVVVAATK